MLMIFYMSYRLTLRYLLVTFAALAIVSCGEDPTQTHSKKNKRIPEPKFKYHLVMFNDSKDLDIVVPDTSKVLLKCPNAGHSKGGHCPILCEHTNIDKIFRAIPLYTMKEWDEEFPNINVKVNTVPFLLLHGDPE